MRRPGGTFGAAQRLSTGEFERPFALAVGASGVAAVLWGQVVRSPENLRNNTEDRLTRPCLVRTAVARAGGSRLLVAWRDRARVTRAGLIRGRVLTAASNGATIGAPAAVSTSDEIEGDVYAAMNSSDGAIVTWTQRSRGDAGNRSAVRQAAGGHFAAPEAISSCAPGVSAGGSGRDNLDTAAHAALDADGRAVAIFASGCGGGAARRPAGGLWQPAFGVTPPATTDGAVRILAAGVSDAGEAVAAW